MKKIFLPFLLLFFIPALLHGQTFSTLLQDKTSFYYVTTYGAKGDSTTNDQTACQNAINAAYAAGGGTVMFPKGVYKVTGIHGRSGVNLFGYDAKIVGDASISGDYILHLEGSLVDNTTLTANALKGTSSLSVTSSADFAANDYIVVSDTTFGNTTDGLGQNQEFNRVLSVGTGTINLRNTLIGNYATASTARVLLYNPIHDVTIEGLTFEVPLTVVAGGIWLEYCYDVKVQNCKFLKPYNPAVNIDKSAIVSISGNTILDGQDVTVGGHGYGIATYESSHHCNIFNNFTEYVRENVISNGSKYINVYGNTFRNSYDDGINTHGSGNHHCVISNNIIEGGCRSGGIIVGGGKDNTDSDILIANNFISNTYDKGIAVTSTTSDSPMIRLSIIGNNISKWGIGTATSAIFLKYMRNSMVSMNTIRGENTANEDYAIYMEADMAVDVSGNILDRFGGYGLLFSTCDSIQILNNKMTNGSDDNFYNAGSNTNIYVNGNITDGIGTLGAVTLGVNNFGGYFLNSFLNLTPQADPPGTPAEGQIYMDTDHHLYVYNGSGWVQMDN